MHHIGTQRLPHLLQRQEIRLAPRPAGAAHDMLVVSSRPDLTPEIPSGFNYPMPAEYLPGAATRLP